MSNWIPKNFDSSWKLHYNSKGWTSRDHGMRWMRECFEPATRLKANSNYRLLLFDGHDSHCSPEFLAHTMEHKILAFSLIPHTSHICQPLDNSIFAPLKRVLSGELNRLFQLGVSRIQKWEWLEAYYVAHQRVFNSNNIKSGFSSTGIYTLDPDKVLNRLPKPHELTPLIPTTPHATDKLVRTFNSNDLTSSPTDFFTFRSNNSLFNASLRNSETVPSDVQQYDQHLTSTAEKLYAQNSILTEEVRKQSEALAKRREVTTGKRIAIRDERLLSTPDVYNKILAADNATKAKKPASANTTKAKKPK